MPWHVVVMVDCSGSMLDSVIHSAVTAAIFAGLPGLTVTLLAFDTRVVDLTDQVNDPLDVLMNVQLGGGTDIGFSVTQAAQYIKQPTRTLFVLISDFEEGGPSHVLPTRLSALRAAGTKVLALAALGSDAKPAYNEAMAKQLAGIGIPVAALTPKHLAQWIAQAIK